MLYLAASHKVHCSDESMRVEIGLSELLKAPQPTTPIANLHDDTKSTAENVQNSPPTPLDKDTGVTGLHIYLEGLKDYPDERCHPKINETFAVFQLSLSDFYECGVTRMINQITVNTQFLLIKLIN